MRLNRYIPMVMMGAAALLTGCSEEELGREGGVGGQMPLTVKVSRTSQPDSRTVLTETTAGLSDEWSGTETLLAFNQAGDKVGELQFVEYGADKTEAVFQGTIDGVADGQYQYRLWYLGATVEGVTPYSAIVNDRKVDGVYPDLVKVMLNTQSGKFADLVCGDLMNVPVNLTVQGQKTYAETTVTMSDCLAMARFHINGAEGVTDGTLTIAYENGNIPYKYYLGPSTGENIATVSAVDNALIVSGVNTSEDVYVVLPPSTSKNLKFTLTSGEDTWTYTTTTNPTIEAGVYYCNATEAGAVNGGFVLDMEKDGGDEPEIKDPNNPGDISNWGGGGINTAPSYTDTGDVSKKYSSGGWCNNDYSIYLSGGWCTPITYHYNGIVDGALYSTRVAEPSYFQWGRWMGFPYNDNMLIINSFGQPVNNNYWAMDNAFALGESIKDNGTVRYQNTQYGSVYGGYFALMATTWWISSGWDNEMALRASIIFGGAESQTAGWQDYLKTNEACNWEDRAGNPCPDGWRIPTIAELRSLIPTSGSVTGTSAEVKTIEDEKFAFRYEVTTNAQSIPVVKITSVRTNKASVEPNDAVFEKATTLTIGAYGIINYEGARAYYGKRAYVWSCETATGGGYSGNAGAALRVIFENGTASFAMNPQDRINAATVIPVRDPDAVHTDITPWFPHFQY